MSDCNVLRAPWLRAKAWWWWWRRGEMAWDCCYTRPTNIRFTVQGLYAANALLFSSTYIIHPHHITGAQVVLNRPHYGAKPDAMKAAVQHNALALRHRQIQI